jgi:GNAT superfamily N-acetyltransferase
MNEGPWEQILDATEGRFLHYDKDRRWWPEKPEEVLVDHVVHRPGMTLVPTIRRSGAGSVKVHAYGSSAHGSAAALARELSHRFGVNNARVVAFLGPEHPSRTARGTRVQLKDFRDPCPPPRSSVLAFEECAPAIQKTFTKIAEEMAADGFAFLYDQMQLDRVGPVLVTVVDETIAGAIGPMELRSDAVGTPHLLPQYFGVLPRFRGLGRGTDLWRAAMCWGLEHGAAYQLLQTEVGGASDRICQAEGLHSLGFVYSVPA